MKRSSAAFGQRHDAIPHHNQEVSQMQDAVRDAQAERADEFGDWRARVRYVGFFTLLFVVVIAVRCLS